MKLSKILILVLIAFNSLFAQSVVKDTSNVKKPKEGGLYYQKSDRNLYLFRNGFELVDLYRSSIIAPPDTSIVNPPVFEKEHIVGFWELIHKICITMR